MIGQEINSVKKAQNLNSGDCVLCLVYNNEATIGQIWNDKNKDGYTYVFQNLLDGSRPYDSRFDIPFYSNYQYSYALMSKGDFSSFVKMILLPQNFEEDFFNYLKQNKKLFSPFLDKYVREDDYEYQATIRILYCYFHDSPNLLLWAMKLAIPKNRWDCNTVKPIDEILRVNRWRLQNKNLVSKLSKGTITAYTSVEDLRNLLREIIEINRKQNVKLMVDKFNTSQRKLIRDFLKDEAIPVRKIKMCERLLSKLSRKSDLKQQNFIRKVSTIENVDMIFELMETATQIGFEWSRESLLQYVDSNENCSSTVIYDKDNVLITKINTYTSMNRLARATNWCISKENNYWRNYAKPVVGETYTENRAQYILWNFNLKEDDIYSMIGFTTSDLRGIIFAHDFINNNLMMKNYDTNMAEKYGGFSYNRSFVNILKELKIPFESLFLNIQKPNFDWNVKSFNKFLDDNNISYDIIAMNDKLVMLTLDNKYDLNKILSYIPTEFKPLVDNDNGSSCSRMRYIFDFSKPYTDLSSVLKVVIGKYNNIEQINEFSDLTDFPNAKSYDRFLVENKMPFSTGIIRPISDSFRALSALSQWDFDLFEKYFTTKDEMIYEIKNNDRFVYNNIIRSSFNNLTLKKIDVLEKHGIYLDEILPDMFCSAYESAISTATDWIAIDNSKNRRENAMIEKQKEFLTTLSKMKLHSAYIYAHIIEYYITYCHVESIHDYVHNIYMINMKYHDVYEKITGNSFYDIIIKWTCFDDIIEYAIDNNMIVPTVQLYDYSKYKVDKIKNAIHDLISRDENLSYLVKPKESPRLATKWNYKLFKDAGMYVNPEVLNTMSLSGYGEITHGVDDEDLF